MTPLPTGGIFLTELIDFFSFLDLNPLPPNNLRYPAHPSPNSYSQPRQRTITMARVLLYPFYVIGTALPERPSSLSGLSVQCSYPFRSILPLFFY